MAYCANCGTELQEGYEFCPECGQAVSNNSTSAYNGKFKTCKNCGEQMPEDDENAYIDFIFDGNKMMISEAEQHDPSNEFD